MAILSDSHAHSTGFPFNHTADDFAAQIRNIPNRDLLAEIEVWQWHALDVAEHADGSRAYVEYQLAAMVSELERRRRLLKAHPGDPLRPSWPGSNNALRDRVRAIKAAWPIERFCREWLGCELIPAGPGCWKARCPLSGHDDRTPSFVITGSKHFAWCFGCQRGGDVIKLAQFALNVDRFTDALDHLEKEMWGD